MTVPAWRIERLEKDHDRKGFDCGEAALNTFLQNFARKFNENDLARTYVAVDSLDGTTVLGYYTLAPTEIGLKDAPPEISRGAGRYAVPAFRLCRIAISVKHQGHGLGGVLIMDALNRTVEASKIAGGRVLVIDAKNERVAAWYGKYGAVAFPDAPLTLAIPLSLYKKAEAKL